MKYYTYKVAIDYGFAPNPFNGVCTLATCKPRIRGNASIGDYIIGLGSTKMKMDHTIIYAMKVNQIFTFNEYFEHAAFQVKKPRINGSKKALRGDNIYYRNSNHQWIQLHSHHTELDGSVNQSNLKRDTSYDRVLISYDFVYFGCKAIPLPAHFVNDVYIKGTGQKLIHNHRIAKEFIEYIFSYYENETGLIGFPTLFSESFNYKGQ